MKQVSNRQKLAVEPRENVQKFLLKAGSMRKTVLSRLKMERKLKKGKRRRS